MKKFLSICLLVLTLGSSPVFAQTNPKATDFPPGLAWLNTDKPLSLSQLKGKFVLLDFWTFCCINCQHILPDLKKLEEKYPKELQVIGVHSAKFATESITDNIREAILRHDITHPVVNDPELIMWHQYDVNGWPTVVLIDPNGNIILNQSGEGVFDPVDLALQKAIPQFGDKINRTPLTFHLEKSKKRESFLDFPGKVIADQASGRLFISDSGHNRIIIANFDGEILNIIGSGQPGATDGAFNQATFFHPQGLALYHDFLMIADTENHLIRRADLVNKTVTTIAGTGQQGQVHTIKGPAISTPLSSPWDLTIADDTLFIAMAGFHQIWAMELSKGTIHPFAGNGYENLADGPLNESALAQPSGITTDGSTLYWADSEASAIRMAEINPKAQVQTLIGHGLFDFGDKDGTYQTARLQHPLGLTLVNNLLYVADTYNNKIKVIDPKGPSSQTFVSGLNEPGGLAYAKGKLFVADSNNHRIAVIDEKDKSVTTLTLHPKGEQIQLKLDKFNGHKYTLPAHGPVDHLTLTLNLEQNYQLLSPSQSYMRIFDEKGSLIGKGKIEGPNSTVTLSPGQTSKIYAELTIFFCKHGAQGLCLIKNLLFEIPIAQNAPSDLAINLELPSEKYK